MFGAIGQYLWAEIKPRLVEIIASSDFILAMLLGLAMVAWGHRLGFANAKLVDVTTALLTYSAIAFGFCLSGLTLALVLPDADFAQFMAQFQTKDGQPNSYSNLMFVFSWAAFVHWLDLIAAIALFAYCGSDAKVLPVTASCAHRLAIGVFTGLSVYAFCRFLTALITLSQVGTLYIAVLAKRAKSTQKSQVDVDR